MKKYNDSTHGTTSPLRRWWQLALAAVALLLLLCGVAPFINAGAFSGRIERALEASLGRKVTFEAAHFTLLTGPGFSLQNVTIQEDPKYGLEPFAHVPDLEVRLRVDKLLMGRFAVSSLRLLQPSLNLVQNSNGTWNVVELVERLASPSHLPIDVFPAVGVSEGRIDFKLGTRKTTLYVSNSDLSIYPERSGKLYIQFSGSPARTDRAGNGFGHVRGAVNWYLKAVARDANQVEADVTLDPSNLSEMTTLVEGEDAGVHGTVGSHMKIEGPRNALRVNGDLYLSDVHRWDLMPYAGDNWRVRYGGTVDLAEHRLDLWTLPQAPGQPTPVALRLRANDFQKHPSWSVLTTFAKAPAAELLPISRRMGIVFPNDLKLEGSVDGVVGYSSTNALAGSISITGVSATFPDAAPIRSPMVSVLVSSDRVHLEPASIDTEGSGTLQLSGDYSMVDHSSHLSFAPNGFPVRQLRQTFAAWFGDAPALGSLRDGQITGKLLNERSADGEMVWSGQFRFAEGRLTLPGLAFPLADAQGHAEFGAEKFDLDHFSAVLKGKDVSASYHFSAASNGPQTFHIEMPTADLTDIEAALEPTLRAQSLFARLGVTRRSIPAWLASRNVRGDFNVGQFSVSGVPMGSLRSHLSWSGTSIQFSRFDVTMPEGSIEAHGHLSVAASLPHYEFNASVTGYPWKGGLLEAQGQFETDGLGADALQNLHADGMFSGENVSLSPEDLFEKVSGGFHFSFKDGWANLRLANVQASQGDEDWAGEANSQSDGKLVLDLESSGRQRHVVSNLAPEPAGDSPGIGGQASIR